MPRAAIDTLARRRRIIDVALVKLVVKIFFMKENFIQSQRFNVKLFHFFIIGKVFGTEAVALCGFSITSHVFSLNYSGR